jgi:hypothetical protein
MYTYFSLPSNFQNAINLSATVLFLTHGEDHGNHNYKLLVISQGQQAYYSRVAVSGDEILRAQCHHKT